MTISEKTTWVTTDNSFVSLARVTGHYSLKGGNLFRNSKLASAGTQSLQLLNH